MASFQAKIDWERLGERENKKNRSDVFTQPGIKKNQKNSKKIQKIKKHHYGFFSSQNRLEIAKNARKKKNCSDEFLPDPE